MPKKVDLNEDAMPIEIWFFLLSKVSDIFSNQKSEDIVPVTIIWSSENKPESIQIFLYGSEGTKNFNEIH